MDSQGMSNKFTGWTWRPDYDRNDQMAVQLQNDLAAKSSVLELMQDYMANLKGNADNNALPFVKLAKLFDLGLTPDSVKGHCYGVPVAIRTGDEKSSLAEFGNVLGFLWGTSTLADVCPWVGKSFSPIGADMLKDIAGASVPSGGQTCLGINHFHEMEFQPLNTASFRFLSWWIGLDRVSPSGKAMYGHEKDGGHFIASVAPSVYRGSNRKVFQLNYRWSKFGTPPPLCWLIDELVQVADGMYLGQLLFATNRLDDDYDPARSAGDYKYQHFGYFVLFDKTWNPEARRLFSYLEIPVTAPGMQPADVSALLRQPKFSTFTFEQPAPPVCDDRILAQVKADMGGQPTIMHLLKSYSDKLVNGLDNDSPYFLRLQELFNRGIGIRTMNGFYRGALVSWHTEGLAKFLNINTLQAGMNITREFSPWTGKSFEDIAPDRLKELTGGYETGLVPTFWGTNTQALRTPKEKFVGKLMNLAGVWEEQVPADEARKFGYDIKCFFFIGRQDKSVNEGNKGKTIFQFNYRWPKLRTIPPDCYCIDELVKIADGLYLGQLMYATELLKPYSPLTDPAEYKYRNFGYFLLMDEEWHRIRLDIGFDMTEV